LGGDCLRKGIDGRCKKKLIEKLSEGLLDIYGKNYNLNIFSYFIIKEMNLEGTIDKHIQTELQKYIGDDTLSLYI